MNRRRIDSPKNPRVKELLRLRERRGRDRSGRFLIEGSREVERALAAGVPLEEVLIAPELAGPAGQALAASAEHAGLMVTELAGAAFGRLSIRENPDGLMALAATWRTGLSELELPADPLLLVVDGVEKPGNLGALLRTADAVDADAVFVTGPGTDPFNPNVIRSSMGSLFSRPLVTAATAELRPYLEGQGVKIVATSPSAERPFWDVDLRGPLALVLGAEHAGLGAEWLSSAHERVHIPMAGLADSLNVATAGALLLYEALRQRRGRFAVSQRPAVSRYHCSMAERYPYDAFIPIYPVHDLAATRDFYVRELGLELERDEGRCLVLRAAGGYLGFRLFDGPLPNHDGLTLALVAPDVDQVYQRLRRLGAETELPPRRNEHYRVYHFFARDPDGYRLEVRQPVEPDND